MFDIGWSEMAVIAVVALVVIGPKELPHLLYKAGQMASKARSILRELQQGIEEIGREAELEELRKQVRTVGSIDVTREIDKAVDPTGDLRRTLSADMTDEAAADRALQVPPPAVGPSEAPLPPAGEPAPLASEATQNRPPAPETVPPDPDRAVS